jgi:hypothetical protein
MSLVALSSGHGPAAASGFIEPCLPSKVARPPSGPLWVHEIKHDGYRLMVRRDGARVRCFTKGGHDWAGPLPGCYRGLSAARLKVRSVLPILMCAHRKSRALGVRFADNKPDVARRATSDDDAVLISGEPEARDIGGRDRIAGDFVIFHYDRSPMDLLEQHDESIRQDDRDGHPHQREPHECSGAGHRCSEKP